MDIVFYGNSMNYDQGSGNYQELKKITKWDGRQYTLVSRYALRYSLLETAKGTNTWTIADGDKLKPAKGKSEGGKKVIQPTEELLFSGEILKYPEFDLFGYLITTTEPQNFREAPVKISHAVSMTPFNYDALFNANVGLANRIRKKEGGMEPNPFTAEEHNTFYQYTVIVHVDDIGEVEVYLKDGEKFKEIEVSEDVEEISSENLDKVNIVKYGLKRESNGGDPKRTRVAGLLKAILSLKRSIKGREEDLSPKLMIVGVYKNKPYKTYKDKINLVDEYVQEEYDEIEESEEDGKKIYKVRHKTSQSRKPIFEVEGTSVTPQQINEDGINKILNKLFDSDQELEELKVFYDTSVQVRVQNQ